MAAFLFTRSRSSAQKGNQLTAGRIANHLMLSSSGVAISYLLSATGRDSAMVKGAAIFAFQWIGLYGLSHSLGVVKSKKHLSDLLSFIDHVGAGATVAALVSALGDDSLYGGKNALPLVDGLTLPLPG